MVPQIFQRLTGKRQARQDYESLLLDKNSLSAISEGDGNGDVSYASNSYGSLLALHSATARGRREWLFFDKSGTASFQDVSHTTLSHTRSFHVPCVRRVLSQSLPSSCDAGKQA